MDLFINIPLKMMTNDGPVTMKAPASVGGETKTGRDVVVLFEPCTGFYIGGMHRTALTVLLW